jgi:hypothetical protein
MSRKNVWRRIGRFEVKRVSGRYSDGSLDGRDVLWIRGPKGSNGRSVAYCTTSYDAPHGPARLGLDTYYPAGSRCDAVATAKAMLRHVRESRP